MKNIIIGLITIFSITISFGQQVIEQADKLIQERKYNSAFKILQDKDPDNKDIDITIKKVDIALNYFVISMMHQMFAIKDLEEDENLYELRANMDNQSLPMYSLMVNDVLEKLIKDHSDQHQLHKSLGSYYYDIHLKYGDNWVMDGKKVLDNMYDNCKTAAKYGKADYMTHYCLGYYYTLQENYKLAIPHFLDSIESDPTYPTSHYNLSISYLYNNQAEKGAPYAVKSIELYQGVDYKSDAARVAGVIYKELKDHKNALKYLKLSDEILPDSYYTINQILEIELELGLIEDSKATATKFFNLAPTNPRICSDLVDIYTLTKKDTELIEFLDSKISENENNKEILGNLYFHLGQYYLSVEIKDKAKNNFVKAKNNFEVVFEKDHDVFEVLNKVLKELE